MNNLPKILSLLLFLLFANVTFGQIKCGAEMTDEYLPMLAKKKVALVVNHTSYVGKTHLVDTLLSLKVKIVKIFAPEHGFKGDYADGSAVKDGFYGKQKIPVVSLYGDKKKPSPKDLEGVDMVIFDMQDVGVRYYTYLTTMCYVMIACVENQKPLIILDRPNPNGFYMDGPVLKPAFKSFVGLHPVPIVYGMTLGEYAMMLNGEGWLNDDRKCDLKVVKCTGYTHDTRYVPPIPPSPNLKTIEAIYLYPSLGLFEGTDVSVGRGTDRAFEIIGKPGFTEGKFKFTPKPIKGVSDNPPYNGQECSGFDLKDFSKNFIATSGRLYLYWLKGFYDASPNKSTFFNDYFDRLAGTDELRKQIISGAAMENIMASWQDDLIKFYRIRAKYLLYTDFSQTGKITE